MAVTVVAPNLTPDDLASRSRNVEVSYDGIHWGKSTTLIFDSAHMTQTVWVRAIDDLSVEGERYVVLQHLVQQAGGEYNGLPMLNAVVRVVDNDEAGVTVVAGKPVQVTEGGGHSTYTLELNKAPSSDVEVTVNPGGELRVSLNGSDWFTSLTVTFTSTDWDAVTIYVKASTTRSPSMAPGPSRATSSARSPTRSQPGTAPPTRPRCRSGRSTSWSPTTTPHRPHHRDRRRHGPGRRLDRPLRHRLVRHRAHLEPRRGQHRHRQDRRHEDQDARRRH